MILTKINLSKGTEDSINKTQLFISNLRKQFQSSNINVILGAGFSHGVFELLGDIETKLFIAEIIDGDEEKVKELKKEFFKGSILPYLDDDKRKEGIEQRNQFLLLLNNIVSNRQSSILHKIINLYTTNYDLLIEESLEICNIKYIDGFSGKIKPKFSTSNYGLIFNRQTSISSMTSEITTCNLYKVHGSLNWDCNNNDIFSVDPSEKIRKIEEKLETDDFLTEYKKLAIINPTKDKLNQTVLNVNYYDQLRMYCNELEKNNTLLLSFGFSFSDEHISSMTVRALQSNPTLSLVVFSFDDSSTEKYSKIFRDCSNANIVQLVESDDDKEVTVQFTLDKVNSILEAVFNGTK